jgi:hypothetical protein
MRDDNAAGMPGTGKLIDGVIASTNSGANLSDGSTIGYNDPSGFNGDNGAPHPGVTFDLGGLFELDQLWIDYIGAGSAAGVAAPDSVDVLFSTDGVSFANMMTFDHFNDTLSTFANFSSRRLVAELDGAMATHVRLDFFNNQEWTFLSEVQFVARSPVIPEPASAALLGLAGVALTLRRRTCRT